MVDAKSVTHLTVTAPLTLATKIASFNVRPPCYTNPITKRKENSMNLQEFQAKVQADRLAQAEQLRKENLAKSAKFLATLTKEGK
jgi:hypothetical protein